MPTLIAMVGLPRSGKSTLTKVVSKALRAPIVNKDDIRLSLHGQHYAKEAEPMVRAVYRIMIESLFRSGHDYVVADETHYSRAARDFIKDQRWQTQFIVVPTPKETCIERAYTTGHTWLPPVIEEMAQRYDPIGLDESIFNCCVTCHWPFYRTMCVCGMTWSCPNRCKEECRCRGARYIERIER